MEDYQKARHYQQELAEQLEYKENQKKYEYEQFLREKAMVDDVVRKIMEENEREMQERMRNREETQAYIQHFLVERQKWQEEEERRRIEEDKAIAEYVAQQQERARQAEAKKTEAEAGKNVIYDMVRSFVFQPVVSLRA